MRNLLNKIPQEFRTEILHGNYIGQAVAQNGNYYMEYLIVIWRDFFEPSYPTQPCPVCLTRVLDGWRQMLPELVKMERENNLLANV